MPRTMMTLEMEGFDFKPNEVLLEAKQALEEMHEQYSFLLGKGKDVSSLSKKIGKLASLYNFCLKLYGERGMLKMYIESYEAELYEAREIKIAHGDKVKKIGFNTLENE